MYAHFTNIMNKNQLLKRPEVIIFDYFPSAVCSFPDCDKIY
jgi:hypothetical protein